MSSDDSSVLVVLGKSTSINVRKVLWTCAELQLPYHLEQWGSGFRPADTPEFRALNPNALVPVIRDDGLVLWESNTICRYLASKAQHFDLLPQAPGSRALVEQWMDWQATELNNSWRYAFMALVRQSPGHTDVDAIATSVRQWNRHMEILEAQLAKTEAYVAGPTFTLADVVVGLSTHRWLMTPMDKPSLPQVIAYYERLSEREGFRTYGRNGIP
jgi:glutathione S-transferase